MFLIDTNIFMYAAGVEHPHKIPAVELLHQIARQKIEACLSTEILQEILHRYRSINKWQAGREVYHLARKIVPVICPITDDIIKKAYDLMDTYPSLWARDCIHIATCLCNSLHGLYSFDADFKNVREILWKRP